MASPLDTNTPSPSSCTNMATLNQTEDEQKNNQQQLAGPTQVAGTAGGSSGGQGAGAGVATSPVAQNAAPQASQGYTDVASYLNANQGGSAQLGQKVSQNLSDKYNNTMGDINTSASSFQNQVGQGYTPQNTDLIKQVSSNPTGATSDQISAFQGQLNDSYTGPTSWGDYGTLQGKVSQAQQYGNLINTPGGANVLTQDVEGPTTSTGINQLDTLLLQGSPDAYGSVKAASDPYGGLNGYLDQQNQAGTQAVNTAKSTADQTAQNALGAFTGNTGTLTNLNNEITHRANTALSTAQAQNTDVQNAIKGLYTQPVDTSTTQLGTYGGGSTPWYNSTKYNVGSLSPEAMSSLGIDQSQWGALQGAMQQAGTGQYFEGNNFGATSPTSQIDLSQFLSQQDPSKAINAGTVATPQEYQQMAAIQNILGSKMPQGAAINPALSSLAGTAPTNFNQFDYASALKNAQGTSTAERTAANDMAKYLSNAADAQHAAEQQHGFGGFLQRNVPLAGQYLANPLLPVNKEINAVKGK